MSQRIGRQKKEYETYNGGEHSRISALSAVEKYIDENALIINDNTKILSSEIFRDIYNCDGEYVESEIVDYVFTFKPDIMPIQPFSVYNESDALTQKTIKLKFNVNTSTIERME